MNEEFECLNNLQPGDNHYKAYVGPPLRYDLIGAMQFNLLTSFGLRDYHKLLDIGCGSLRSGKLFIPFLRKGNYYGVEPNKWLIEEGIKYELGSEIIKIKSPTFNHSDNFDLKSFDQTFDFIIAQSIFSHTSKAQINKCLTEVETVLATQGLFLATFVLGKDNYEGNDWVYPGCVTYQNKFIIQTVRAHNLECIKTKWHHPNGQTWYIIFHPKNSQNIPKLVEKIFDINRLKPEPKSLKSILMGYKIFNNRFTKHCRAILKS